MRVLRARCIGTALALGFACADAGVMPAAAIGRWVSDDPRFAGRTLEIGSHVVRFVDGNAELDAVVIRAVEVTSEPGTSQRVAIEGNARDGAAVALVFELERVPSERLRLETQTALWRRAESSAPGIAP